MLPIPVKVVRAVQKSELTGRGVDGQVEDPCYL